MINHFIYLTMSIFLLLVNTGITWSAYSSELIQTVRSAQTECLYSFESYWDTTLPFNSDTEPLPPSEEVVPNLPLTIEERGSINWSPQFARFQDGLEEIWFLGLRSSPRYWDTTAFAATFHPSDGQWRMFPAMLEGTGVIISHLFTTSDGTIWGIPISGVLPANEPPSHLPALVRFNHLTERFETVASVLSIPVNNQTSTRIENDLIFTSPVFAAVADSHNTIWLFVRQDGIYQFDPIDGITEKVLDANYTAGPVIGPDENLYFLLGEDASETFLYQLNTDTHHAQTVPMPLRTGFENAYGFLFDAQGQLWLGLDHYRDNDGQWHHIHAFQQNRSTPMVILTFASSDGRLWYRWEADFSPNGAAWYNPNQREGCVFTDRTLARTFVEDSEHNLWFATGRIYRMPLYPQ